MQSQSFEPDTKRVLLTLEDIIRTIEQVEEWNRIVSSVEDYYSSQTGMQLLAANCALITAIGEGVNRCNRILPDFLSDNFPSVPWRAIIGMRNRICHGYFELDGELIFEAVKTDIPFLKGTISSAIDILKSNEP